MQSSSNPTSARAIARACSFASILTLTAATANASAAQDQYFAGFFHAAHGGAQLSLTPQGLRVSNLGSSGLDGVSVDLGESEAVTIGHEFQPVPGGVLSIVGHGSTVSSPGIRTVRMDYATSGNCTHVQPDFSGIGAMTYTARIYHQGALVSEQTGLSGGGVDLPQASGPIYSWLLGDDGCIYCGWLLDPVIVTPASGVSVVGDAWEFEAENAAFDVLRTVDVLGSGLPSFTLNEEILQYDGLPLIALGDAHLDPGGAQLHVDNLGSSGLDGVRASLGGSDYAAVEWQNLELAGPHSAGDEVQVDVRGTVGGVSNSPLGSIRMIQTSGNSKDIVADYGAVGSTTFIVEVWNGGVQVASTQGHTGTIASVPTWPGGCKKRDTWGTWDFPCFAPCWPSAVAISIPGLGTFMGDELRVLAEGSVSVVSLDEIDVLVTGISEMTITGVHNTPPEPGFGTTYCTANPNSTGVVAQISAVGSPSAADNDLSLNAWDLPANSFAFFIVSQGQVFVPNAGGGQGNLCVGPSVGRGPGGIFSSGALGMGTVTVDLTQLPTPTGTVSVMAGETWNFQVWYRDTAPSGATSNFSGGLALDFQ